MKTFKQSFQEKGEVRSVTGELIVSMNYFLKPIQGTHGTMNTHKIEVFIDGKLVDGVYEIESDATLLKQIEKVKPKLIQKLKELSNQQPEKSFVDKMKELGFTTNS